MFCHDGISVLKEGYWIREKKPMRVCLLAELVDISSLPRYLNKQLSSKLSVER